MLENDVAKYTTWGFNVQSPAPPMIKVADKFQFDELLGPSRTITPQSTDFIVHGILAFPNYAN